VWITHLGRWKSATLQHWQCENILERLQKKLIRDKKLKENLMQIQRMVEKDFVEQTK